jgi:hypothetical protein
MPGEKIASTMNGLGLLDMSNDKVVIPTLCTRSDGSGSSRWLLCYTVDSIYVVQLLSL